VQVATRFLAAVKESSGPGLNMAFFISCDPEDVMRQAEESTLRYQRGNVHLFFCWRRKLPFLLLLSAIKHLSSFSADLKVDDDLSAVTPS
jgi:hypothetical protein